ncbi:flagellar protein FlbB [Treponema sp. OMZ 789]|uniref:periplasmic-type flagellar collar protein FlbB n=1 Tax=Treponema sp. OMZ 790 TaxID=2563665 RepID=UPI0020A5C365|nr:flagellar protein FlbB [Treponema sp. OMZ 790]UTC68458.1 flagellar protein FlbB [Treponema sp. OMZ 789]UTC71166.1 flagellar protein FlbB [Treponema sp. OMZ 790]UTC73879.1 flagellar protein FlbB [Treponema sp. OMZ 791]
MRRSGTIGRIIVLLILIILLIFGGLLWFDYLGLISSRSLFSPVYSLFGLKTAEGIAPLDADDMANLENDRYEKRLLALEVRSQELDKREEDVQSKENEHKQIAEELDDRRAAIEEKEKNYNLLVVERDAREANIVQIAKYINGMVPEKAVDNLLSMDDQDVIDVLRAVERLAAEEGKNSSVAYWFSLMPPARAAEIQRKMANKPVTFP